MQLDGARIIVTGASRGLGKAMASAFVREGARVVCASRTAEVLEAAVEEMTAGTSAGEAIAVPTDVRSWEDVQALVDETEDAYGGVDVLVNNAALRQYHLAGPDEPRERPIRDIPIDVWDATQETNVRGVFLCTKAVLPGMESRGNGRIVHISSSHGAKGRANRAPYVTSKFALEGFHETLALELEGTGVDSIALRPPGGGIFTSAKGESGVEVTQSTHASPSVIEGAAIRLASGEGENGGRYAADPDGSIEPYSR